MIPLLREQLGDETELLMQSLGTPPVISVRVNPFKSSDAFAHNPRVPWCKDGRYLDERPSFTLDPLLHAGAYYVQEASSMFVCQVIQQLASVGFEPHSALDLCAAPGGKTTALLSSLPATCLVVSNEFVPSRAHVLRENVVKWGRDNVVVTNNAARDFGRERGVYDLILIDAPCSGEGMLRKDVAVAAQWSEQNVEMCATRQREIIQDVLPALKEGGVLIYSTCTFNRKEDEEMAFFIERQTGMKEFDLDIPSDWNIVRGERGYHFYPHRVKGEGLYLVVFTNGEFSKSSSNMVSDDYETERFNDTLLALPSLHASRMRKLLRSRRVLTAGVELGTYKGKNLIPATGLALSCSFLKLQEKGVVPSYPQCEVDLSTALKYLHREAVSLPPSFPTGFVVLTYKGLPLGFVKNLGNRANNLYPEYWRIRHI